MIVKPADRTSSVQEYYFSAKLRQIDEMRNSGIDVINLGIGSPDMPPSENTLDRLSSESRKQNVHGYQSYSGSPVLRKAFAKWYFDYFNVILDPEGEVLPLIGSKEGIMHISMAFVNNEDEVLVPDPGYPAYSSSGLLTGGSVRTYDLEEKNGWMPDFNRIEESGMKKVKMMWVNYPHMPTGTPGSHILFDRLIRFAHKHNILIINDNPYSFILNNDYKSILKADGAKEVALELNSLSKSHNMAGWRIGMVAGHKDYIQTVLKVKSNMDSGMFLPVQLAAAEALANPAVWYEKINSAYRKRRIIAEDLMNIIGCSFNREQTGMFLWGHVPDKYSSGEQLSDNLLLNNGIFITPGIIFGRNGVRYVRISLCSNEETLLKARERIKTGRQKTGDGS